MAAGRIFDALGVEYEKETAGLFLWGRVPGGNGEALSEKILHSAGVFITPGFVFGKNGEEYVRISLCATVDKLKEALERIEKLSL